MSLKKQLLIVLLLLFFLLFIGTFSLSAFYTRHYLANQLESNTQNTATSLGLSVTTLMQEKDEQRMLLMIQAVFNSGYYTNVAIKDLQGKTIVARSRDIHIANIPAWFIHLIALHPPTATAPIISGWNVIGEVQVTAHPGYAYQQLWQTLWGLFSWFIIITLLLILLGIITLSKILKPLKRIQQQAEDICDRKFTQQKILPSASELKPVVSAMNRMSLKVKEIIYEQSEEIKHLNQDAYLDNLTPVFNRKYLYSILTELTINKASFVNAALAIVEITSLEELKRNKGFPAFKNLINQIALTIKNTVNDDVTIARLNNQSFALFYKNQDPTPSINALIPAITLIVEHEIAQDTTSLVQVGLYQFQQANFVSEIMSAADNALKQSQVQNKNYAQLQQTLTLEEIKSASEWLTILETAIKNDSFVLYFQPVKNIHTNQIFHYETFLRIKDFDNVLSAQQFFPYAELYGKAYLLDKIVIEKITLIAKNNPELHFAINLSHQALLHPEFKHWFSSYLQQHQPIIPQLAFETSEAYLIKHLTEASELFKMIKSAHASYGIDNFGRSFSNFGYLQWITPDYIKFSGSLSDDLENDPNMQFFIKSILHIAHTLDCKAIAGNVENAAQAETLTLLKVDGLQGYLIGKALPQNEYF